MQGWILLALAAWGQNGDVPLTGPAAPAYAAPPAYASPAASPPAAGTYRPGDLRQSLQQLRDTKGWPGRTSTPPAQPTYQPQSYALPPIVSPGGVGHSAPRPLDQPPTNPNYPVQLAAYGEPVSNSAATVGDEDAPAPLPPAVSPQPIAPREPTTATGPLAAPLRPREPLPLSPRGSKSESNASTSRPAPSASSSVVTVVASLAIVLGLFFVVIWFLRRAAGAGPAQLPSDAVSILGQVSLSPRQSVHLLRVANKLLVVCSNGETAVTLTEIEDEEEVNRIAGLCAATQPGSATNAFRDILGQLGNEPTTPGFLGASGGNAKSPFAGFGLGDDD